LTELRITDVRVIDLRFPTSRESIGSDAVNKDPDYSAAYCILETNRDLRGFGLTFTCGHGNDLCCDAIRYLSRYATGRTLSSITDDLGAFSSSSPATRSSAGSARKRESFTLQPPH
jgi:L-fuconate dehydratase